MSNPLPRITFVTPSFQQARFLDRTISSVLDQRYPNLEYMIVDGGSTDGSLDIIRRHASRLAWWCSEKDNGQAAAINKGLRRATGEIVGWLNSDDTLAPGALAAIAEAYRWDPGADLVYGHTCLIDEQDRVERCLCAVRTDAPELIRYNRNIWSQPGTTWRRRLHDQIGYLDETLDCTMDCDFWIRAAQGGRIRFVPRHLGNLRSHSGTKSNTRRDRFEQEHRVLDSRYGCRTLSAADRAVWRVRRWCRIATDWRTLHFRFLASA